MNGFHIVSSQHLILDRARAEEFYGEEIIFVSCGRHIIVLLYGSQESIESEYFLTLSLTS